MTSTEQALTPPDAASRPLAALESHLARLLVIDGEKLAYALIFILAVLTRFWDLGARVMSHDESLHTRYSWGLYRGDGFAHTPLMHGPLLFHVTALMYLLFGDSDFSARIYPAVVGIIVVMLPIAARRWLGRTGALAASFMFLISPLIMYYSRYIREDMPALLGALIMVLAIWHYIESRRNRYLLWLSFGFAILYATKEVSFIYVAIFGSFLTLYFVTRLLDVRWDSRRLNLIFAAALIATLISLTALGVYLLLQEHAAETIGGTETAAPVDPAAGLPDEAAPVTAERDPVQIALMGASALSLVVMAGSVLVGQWKQLRQFPELDVMIVLGSLILPMLTPFLIHAAGFNPMDETSQGVATSLLFTLPMLFISIGVGVAWGMQKPIRRRIRVPVNALTAEELAQVSIPEGADNIEIEVEPDLLDWVQAALASRWWAIGAVFWLFFLFFFTTMFTNGAGLGTGVIGSLAYWLEQQGVKRGNQPWYYYLMIMLPIYEFLPVILSAAAGALGLGRLVRSALRPASLPPSDGRNDAAAAGPGQRLFIDLQAPIAFPIFAFTAYWGVLNIVAYSIAGEKMPWLTTHLTAPFILLGGWMVGRLLESIEWKRIVQGSTWLVLLLLPLLLVSLLRVTGPICSAVVPPPPLAVEATAGIAPPGAHGWGEVLLGALKLPCTTVIPERFQQGVFKGVRVSDLYATYAWLAAVIVLAATVAALFTTARRLAIAQLWRLTALWLVVWLAFLTARTALIASFVNYDQANEYLVYAHSAGAVKQVMDQIEEISLKTTDGYGLRVAYDNQVSWPLSWYLRNYYNAVYYGEQPSRGLIGDAPVILAGPGNWAKVEPLLGGRYYQFEYIRMWWPMQDYFGYEEWPRMRAMLADVLTDPGLQRGIRDIFFRRDYSTYADAVSLYRGARPDFSLSRWPVSERMRVYIRKDVFAQVWDYGVAASEIAQATDPYAEGVREMVPVRTFGAGMLARPHGISMGPDGLIYIADSGNHRIVVFDQQGNFVRSLSKYGLAPAPDAVNEPWDVTVGPDGTIYIADTWNHRIVEYSAQGQYVRNWGFEGPNVGDPLAFWGPRGITTDNEGRIYLADTGNKRIVVFNRESFFVRQIGTGGGQEGELDEPVGLAIGPDGSIYVADTWNQRIQVFDPEGRYLRQWYVDAWFAQTNERPYIEVDASGNVYVTDPEAYRIIVFNSAGDYLYSFGDYTTIGLAGSVLATDSSLYVVDTANGLVQVYELDTAGSPAE